MNEIFQEIVEKKKFHVNELQKQLQNGSKSIVDNRLILESVILNINEDFSNPPSNIPLLIDKG